MKIRILAGLLFAVALGAQDREAPPPLGTPKPFAIPPTETFTLANGMKVTLSEYGAVPLVSVRADIAFGNGNESADQTWISDFLTNMMKEGTTSLTAQQIANEAARMGGQFYFNAGVDASSAGLDVLSEFAPDAVKLVADVLQHPKFPASELERNRADLLRQLSVQLSTPGAKANQAFAAALYPNHPYGRLFPTEAQLKSYTLDDLRKFYAANLSAKKTHFYVVGRFDSAAVKKTIESYFVNWAAGEPVQRNPPKEIAKPTMVILDRPDAVQSTLRVGIPINVSPTDKDYIPMQVTNTLLGGAFTSRITNNIREQKGYTYSPFSQVVTRYHTTRWQESADVTTKFTADSVREIFNEVNRLRKDPPDDKELKGVQNFMDGIFVLQNSSNQGIIGQLSFLEVHGLTDDYIKTYIQKVNAVTRSDVQRITESYLNPNKMTLVVVGDKAKIEDSLKSYQPKP
ncbi:MAG TPA: pitrilysin family protein [Bryobacteraceae bacterium]|nr:pitrilysin family protein [Bryobacteraceae bacterium]